MLKLVSMRCGVTLQRTTASATFPHIVERWTSCMNDTVSMSTSSGDRNENTVRARSCHAVFRSTDCYDDQQYDLVNGKVHVQAHSRDDKSNRRSKEATQIM